ncbi:MAG TPA: hypothetical protein VMH81_12000 [Bryobacteraceae bacterium]|nr:hypothetical protein [Bryobacteraceae bacterium]
MSLSGYDYEQRSNAPQPRPMPQFPPTYTPASDDEELERLKELIAEAEELCIEYQAEMYSEAQRSHEKIELLSRELEEMKERRANRQSSCRLFLEDDGCILFARLKGGRCTMATQPAPAHTDPVNVDPKHYSVEYEDARVRVLRIKYGPHEKSTMHGHPALVGVMLTDVNIRFAYPDGKTEEISGKAGLVVNFPALEHLPENLSDQPFEAIAVELKG